MADAGFEQCKRELDYAKHQLETVIALFSYDKPQMINLNKTRAMCSIDCIKDVMQTVEEYINER